MTYPYFASIPLCSNRILVSYHSTAEKTNARMENKLERTAKARNHRGLESAHEAGKMVSSAIAAVAESEKRAAAGVRMSVCDSRPVLEAPV